MFRHSRPLRGRRDRFVNGYNLIGGNDTETETEEEITDAQRVKIDNKISAFLDKKIAERDEKGLFYDVLTPSELDKLDIYLLHSDFNNFAYYNAVGKGSDNILRSRLDDLLKTVRTSDNTAFLQDLEPFDKYYYAVLKTINPDMDNNDIEEYILTNTPYTEPEPEPETYSETTEEEITPAQQKVIDKKIEDAIDYKTNPNRQDWFLYYTSFTPDELDVLHRYLTHSRFDGFMFNKVIGKDWQESLPTRLDNILKKYYSKDNKYLTSLKPFDKFYYAILKDKGLTDNEIEDLIPSNNQSFDDLLLLNDSAGYDARTEAGSFFTSGVTSGKVTNEVGWEAEKQFAETVYPVKYGNGTPLEISYDKYLYFNSYFETYDFTVGNHLFEIKTQPKNLEVRGPLYYCQISKFYKIPSNISVFTIWWGKIKSKTDLIQNRTPITDWRYIDFNVNELGDGKRFHFKKDGLYDNNKMIAYKDVQGGHQYSQNPEATQVVFVDDDLKEFKV